MNLGVDVAIVGAGIVGAACADALTAAGATVAIIEPNIVGGGATAAGMGHIVVMDDSESQFALTNYSRNLWTALVPEMPADIEFQRSGTLWAAADEQEMEAVHAKLQFYRDRGVRAEVLNQRTIAEAEPNLRPGLAGGLLVPDDAVVYSPRAAAWLLARAQRRGAKLYRNFAVETLDKTMAGSIICAAGAWALQWFPDLDIKPRKGHLAITDRYPNFVHHQIIELGYLKSAHASSADSVAFNAQPRATGQLLIGSSRQFGQTNPQIDSWMLERMLRRAVEYMPKLANLSIIRTWTGFRAATSDHLPLIGPHPEQPHVYLATGHEGLGIATSLGTAQLLTAAILGQKPAIDPTPFLPGREVSH